MVFELARLAGINRPQGIGFLLGIVIEHQGVRYLLHRSTGIFTSEPAITLPASATLDVEKALSKPAKKSGLQAERILAALRELGYDPKNLPPQRKDGPKERAWRLVKGEAHMFQSKNAFDKAWDSLRSSSEIMNNISPHKE